MVAMQVLFLPCPRLSMALISREVAPRLISERFSLCTPGVNVPSRIDSISNQKQQAAAEPTREKFEAVHAWLIRGNKSNSRTRRV